MKTRQIRILIIFLAWIAPFQKLNSFVVGKSMKDLPTYFDDAIEQLKQIEKFANMLIISEGVVEGSTNLSTLAIDFMIMGHMRNKPGWIGQIGDREIEQELQPLRNILDNGMNTEIEVEEVSKMFDIIKNLPVAYRISSKAQELSTLIEKAIGYLESLLEAMDGFKFEKLLEVRLVEDLTIAPNFKDLLNGLLTLFRFFDTITDYTSSGKLDEDDGLVQYMDFLYSVPDMPDYEVIKKSLHYLLQLKSFCSDPIQKKYKKYERTLNETHVLLKNRIGKISEDDAKVYGNIIETLKEINTEKLKSMDSFLKLLLNFYESFSKQMNSTDSSFVNSRFNSYLGFENDIGMFEKMADSLDPNHEFPSQFSKVPLRSRSIFIQKLAATLHPFLELSNGLLLVDDIGSLSFSIGQMADNILSDYQEHVKYLDEHISKMSYLYEISNNIRKQASSLWYSEPAFRDVQRLADAFQMGDEQYENFKHHLDFAKELFELADLVRGSGYQPKRDDPIDSRIRSAHDYAYKVSPYFRPRVKENDLIGKDVKSLHFDIDKIQKKLFAYDPSHFKAIYTDWKSETLNYLTEELLTFPGKCESINKKLIQQKEEVAKIDRQLSQFETLRKFEDITKDQELIEKTKELLKLVSNSSIIDFKVNEVPSEKMSKLIAGTPFGSDILDNLHNGIHSYQSLVDGLILTGNLEQKIEKLKSEDLKLGGKVEKLLNGVEVIEVVTDINHSNPFEYLQTMPFLIEHLENAADWVKRKSGQIIQIKEDLGDLKNNFTNATTFSPSSSSSSAIAQLHHFVSHLNEDTESDIRSLKNGIRTIFEELSYFETTQAPTSTTQLFETTTILETTTTVLETTSTTSDTTEISETTTTLPSTVTPVTAYIVGIQVEATTEEITKDSTSTTWTGWDNFFILLVLLLLMLLVPHAFHFYKEHKKVGN